MSPTFMGSEPTSATYDGEKITLFKPETKAGLALLRSLTSAQRKKVVSTDEKGGTDMVAGAGQDNLKPAYQGLAAQEFTSTQRRIAVGRRGLGVVLDEHDRAVHPVVEGGGVLGVADPVEVRVENAQMGGSGGTPSGRPSDH